MRVHSWPRDLHRVEVPLPGVAAENFEGVRRQRTLAYRGSVVLHSDHAAHPGNYGGDRRIRETESQRHFRQRAILGTQIFLQGVHSFYYLLLSIAAIRLQS